MAFVESAVKGGLMGRMWEIGVPPFGRENMGRELGGIGFGATNWKEKACTTVSA